MTIIAVTMVKDEADVIGATLMHLFAHGVDEIIVADNMSTDATRSILEDIAADFPLVIVDDLEPGYYQSAKMSSLAVQAWEAGATWVLPFDADEIWYPTSAPTIAEALKNCTLDVILAWGWDHIPQPSDEPGHPFTSMIWRREHEQTLPKCAFRADPAAVLKMGNHDVVRAGMRGDGILNYRHFQWRSPEQLARKVRQGRAAYEASDLHKSHGAHWRKLGALDDNGIAAEWQALLDSTGLVRDPAPVR